MQEYEKLYFRKKVSVTLDALRKNKFDSYFFESRAKAKKFILDQINPQETVGIGGSITLREDLQIVEEIRQRGNVVYDHWEAEDSVQRLGLARKQREVDVFLSGINAITSDGILVNLDGGGNRVASLCSGPKKVIVAAGVNKLVNNLDSAIDRVRNKAAPLNAMRLKINTPCVETGICSDCNSNERICAALLILLEKTKHIEHFVVILVNEEMGC